MSGSTKKPYHHKDLAETLIAAGEAAMAEMPPEEVSLREIARRAGVSHAAPKHHFPTLGDLLGEIAARGFEKFVKTLDEAAHRAPDQSPPARLQAMGRAYLRYAQSNPAIYGLMFGKREQCAVTPHLAEASLTAWSQLETAVAAIIGPIKAVNGAVMVWSTVHGLAMLMLERRLPPHISPHAAIEEVSRLMIAGLNAET
jgi:AcrR family transcriptional regulator